MSGKNSILVAFALLALAVVVGAFGAHALMPILKQHDTQATFQTGMSYWFYHALGLLGLGLLRLKYDHKLLGWAALSLLLGILFFSGSLSILSVTGVKKWGAVAPVGGLAFVLGWVLAMVGFWQTSRDDAAR